jgi:transposase
MTRRQGLLALDDWLTAVEAGDQPALHSFARGIRRDQQAVTAGLALSCSSGTLEGENCKIKYLNGSCTAGQTSTCSGRWHCSTNPATQRDRIP